MTRFLALCSLVALAACQGASTPAGPARADLSAEVRRSPPEAEPGVCWGSDITPAVIETVTEQVVATPATLAPDGTVLTPATYRSETQQKILQDRAEVWFRTPCPEEMTVDFIATLQRALKARGLYLLPLTGQMDAPTGDALRRYQAPLGLDSAVLSLEAARDLGLVTVDLELE